MSIAVTTRSYDNARSGANTSETTLSPSAIRSRGIRHLFSLALPGDARGCEAQPLIVPGVKLKSGAVHDIVYVATMANQVFAFDANTGAKLWMVQLGTPIKGSEDIDAHVINDHWGDLSTPAIDTQSSLLYACAWTGADQSWQKGEHYLHAIRLQDGGSAHPPLNLESQTYNPGHGRPNQKFRSAERKQRAALLLANGAVFISFGTIAESAQTARGWVIQWIPRAFVYRQPGHRPRRSGGGIWHSGAGPAADADGNIYVLTDGEFEGVLISARVFKLRKRRRRALPGSLRPWSGGRPDG